MIGVVLAGGKSRRFGSPKAFAKLDEQHFYEKVYEALQDVCDEILIVSRKEHLAWYPSQLHVITDDKRFEGMGPLAGIYSAMTKVDGEQYFTLPCDMPFITGDILSNIKNKANLHVMVNAVVDEQQSFPLVSIWNSKMKLVIEKSLLQQERSVMGLLQQVATNWMEAKDLTVNRSVHFQNINTPLK